MRIIVDRVRDAFREANFRTSEVLLVLLKMVKPEGLHSGDFPICIPAIHIPNGFPIVFLVKSSILQSSILRRILQSPVMNIPMISLQATASSTEAALAKVTRASPLHLREVCFGVNCCGLWREMGLFNGFWCDFRGMLMDVYRIFMDFFMEFLVQ